MCVVDAEVKLLWESYIFLIRARLLVESGTFTSMISVCYDADVWFQYPTCDLMAQSVRKVGTGSQHSPLRSSVEAATLCLLLPSTGHYAVLPLRPLPINPSHLLPFAPVDFVLV